MICRRLTKVDLITAGTRLEQRHRRVLRRPRCRFRPGPGMRHINCTSYKADEALSILTESIFKPIRRLPDVSEGVVLIMSEPQSSRLPQAKQHEQNGVGLSPDHSGDLFIESRHDPEPRMSIDKLGHSLSSDRPRFIEEEIKLPNRDTDNAIAPCEALNNKPHSVFNHNERRLIILCAGICSFFSPVSGSIYLPALDTIGDDLHVSYTLITLTVTTYMVSHRSHEPLIFHTVFSKTDISLNHARSRSSIHRRVFR
jgi:hypothetical protein